MDVDDNTDSGLFNISISDSEAEDDVDVSHGIAQAGGKRDRTGQSEAQFEAVKRDYRAKVENGNVSDEGGDGCLTRGRKRDSPSVRMAADMLWLFVSLDM